MGRLSTLSANAQVLYNRMQEVQAEKKIRDDRRTISLKVFKSLKFGTGSK